MSTKNGQVRLMESGPESTLSEDLSPNDWWICQDPPGPPVERMLHKVEVNSSNWIDFNPGYSGPPGRYNYLHTGTNLFRRGLLLGRIQETEVIVTLGGSAHRHTYTYYEYSE